jgi:hypothetical protein
MKAKDLILGSTPRDEWIALVKANGFQVHPGSSQEWPMYYRDFGPCRVLVFDAPNTGETVHVSLTHKGNSFMSAQVGPYEFPELLRRTIAVMDQYASPRTWMDAETLRIISDTLEFGGP